MAMRGILVVAAAGAVVVALAVLWSQADGTRRSAAGPGADGDEVTEEARQRRLGVQGADVDSARRVADDDPTRRAGFTDQRREARERGHEAELSAAWVVPRVSPPILPSEAAIAETREALAASPAVQAEVDAAVEGRRAQVRRNCWSGDALEPASFPIEATYSAEGTMLTLSVGEDARAPGVGACVSGQSGLVPATVEAPGVSVTVRTTLRLP